MSSSSRPLPAMIMAGLGVAAGALAVLLIGSPALVALFASLLTAAVLAPLIAGSEAGDWAGRLSAGLAEAVGKAWPAFRVRSDREGRHRVFACLVGFNLAIFASFFLRGS